MVLSTLVTADNKRITTGYSSGNLNFRFAKDRLFGWNSCQYRLLLKWSIDSKLFSTSYIFFCSVDVQKESVRRCLKSNRERYNMALFVQLILLCKSIFILMLNVPSWLNWNYIPFEIFQTKYLFRTRRIL